MTLLRLGKQADIVFQNNISLHTLIPLLMVRKPIVITHHTWLTRVDGRRGWQDHAKRLVLGLCRNVAISRAILDALPVKAQVISNPFDNLEFESDGVSEKKKDIIFMGRLVSDKGCDLLLRAAAILKTDGLTPSITIVGDGPESPVLKALAITIGVSDQVTFLGALREGRGKEVAQHKILAIPSKWAEPFGLVALEGIAARCAIVASSQGGLAEAVGPCGLLCPNGDINALASALRDLLIDPTLRERLVACGPEHLKRFMPNVIAQEYLTLFRKLLAD
ncbi:MAG: glycosyltransferase family 4 protein [Terracidiphilus sp.]|nr:glycosyltransferase family 4 protein [Terracidiphilus sp.]